MSRTILATYNLDTTAGNNPQTNYKVAATDDANTPIGLDMNQLSAAISMREGVATPVIVKDPDVDGVFLIDWTDGLSDSQGITAVTWTLDGLTEDYNFISDTQTLLIYSGGALDSDYDCSCEVTYKNKFTAASDTESVDFTVSADDIASLSVTTSTQLTDTYYEDA